MQKKKGIGDGQILDTNSAQVAFIVGTKQLVNQTVGGLKIVWKSDIIHPVTGTMKVAVIKISLSVSDEVSAFFLFAQYTS